MSQFLFIHITFTLVICFVFDFIYEDQNSTEEFDSGSEQTLAACLIHASRTGKVPSGTGTSGARVRNAWIICPQVGNNQSKDWLIPHKTTVSPETEVKGFGRQRMSPRPISLMVR